LPPAVNFVSDLLAGLHSFVKGQPQYDDVTIVALGFEWSADDEPETRLEQIQKSSRQTMGKRKGQAN
jgi:hypothetical protein